MDAWAKPEVMDFAGASGTEAPFWRDMDSELGSPKPWAMVDMPDLFLTNLIHDVDHTFGDDSLTEFSSTVANSGSEAESSPGAFQEFMMRRASPESFSLSPPPLAHDVNTSEAGTSGVPDANTQQVSAAAQATPMGMDRTPASEVENPPTPPFDSHTVPAIEVETTQGIAPAFVQTRHGESADALAQALPLASSSMPAMGVVPPSAASPLPTHATQAAAACDASALSAQRQPPSPPHASSSTKTLSTNIPSQESVLAPLHMRPGSNNNAVDALQRLRAVTHESEKSHFASKPKPVRVGTTESTRHASRSLNVPADGDDTSLRKNAHNAIERRYRSNINDRIMGLRDVVPALRELQPRSGRKKRRRGKAEEIELVDGVRAATKLSKATILTKATEYICYLKSREVQLSREVAGLHMLLRSFEGGDELMAQWSVEMERLNHLYPPIEAVYGEGGRPPLPTDGDESDDADADDGDADEFESVSSGSSAAESVRASKVARYMLGAFVGLSVWAPGDWGVSEHEPPARHAHVMGVGHQVWKRSFGAASTPHFYDRVPAHSLAWEVVRGCVLVGVVAAVLCAAGTHLQQWMRRRGRARASRLQQVWTAKDLLRSPLEHAEAQTSARPQTLEEARQKYTALGTHLGVPRTHLVLVWQMAWMCVSIAGAALVPPLRWWMRSAADPTAALFYRRAHMRRAEMEVALGRELQPEMASRLYTLLALQRECVVHGAQLDESLLLALTYCDLGQRARMTMLKRHGAHLWRATAAQLVDATGAGTKERGTLADLLSVPVHQACAFARTVPGRAGALQASPPASRPGSPTTDAADAADAADATDATDAPPSTGSTVGVSPLANMLDACRHETLLTYWTTMIASMMRVSGAPQTDGKPPVLDIVQDAASLSAVEQQLRTLARDRPWHGAGVAAEQMHVAFGMLDLAAGRLSRAEAHAKALGSKPASLAAQHFRALWRDTPLALAHAPVGPVDMLASVAIGWFAWQRMHTAQALRPENLAQCASSLQALASQCLWTFVSPDKGSACGLGAHVRGLLHPSQVPCLANALDSLMDHLSW